jgi:hypothetical protein
MAQDRDIQKIIQVVNKSGFSTEEKESVIQFLQTLQLTPYQQASVTYPYRPSWLTRNISPILALMVTSAAIMTWFPFSATTIPMEMTGYINSALMLVLAYFFGSSIKGNNSSSSYGVSGE